jgi:hypothetical protein
MQQLERLSNLKWRNYTKSIFVICTFHEILLAELIQGDEEVRACSTVADARNKHRIFVWKI